VVAPLETVASPDDILRSLLTLLGIEPGRGDDLDSLLEGLRFREILLIFDNNEYILDAVAAVTREIVSACPAVRMLATSREPLDIEGGRAWRVRPLPTDDAGPAFELFRLRAEEAGVSIDPERDGSTVLRS
jgi:predicted ATPase